MFRTRRHHAPSSRGTFPTHPLQAIGPNRAQPGTGGETTDASLSCYRTDPFTGDLLRGSVRVQPFETSQHAYFTDVLIAVGQTEMDQALAD